MFGVGCRLSEFIMKRMDCNSSLASVQNRCLETFWSSVEAIVWRQDWNTFECFGMHDFGSLWKTTVCWHRREDGQSKDIRNVGKQTSRKPVSLKMTSGGMVIIYFLGVTLRLAFCTPEVPEMIVSRSVISHSLPASNFVLIPNEKKNINWLWEQNAKDNIWT